MRVEIKLLVTGQNLSKISDPETGFLELHKFHVWFEFGTDCDLVAPRHKQVR
jgi:hypothetical protein